MSKTRTYDVRLLAESFGVTDGSGHTRAAVLYITNDLPRLTAALEPASVAGLRTCVMTLGRHRVVISRNRVVPFLPIYLGCEDWSAYTPAEALTAFRHHHRWDRDDDAAEARWTALAAGHQVMVWDPSWGRDDRLWPALRAAGLPGG